jgi:hypothetical protein
LLPSTGAERCSNAYRSHPLPVGAPASHRRGPPGRCPLPLATPDARYGPRSASASAVLPSLPWATRQRPNAFVPLRPPPAHWTSTQRHEARTMFSKPLAYPSTLDRLLGVLRGGALEPDASYAPGKSQAKAHAYSLAQFQRRAPRVFLSQAGPRFDLGLLQAEHHLWFRWWSIASRNDEGDPVGSPSAGSLCG